MAGTQVFPSVPSTGGGGSAALTWPGWFGDAADGDFTVTTTGFSPARERNYNNLTVNSGASMAVSGFRVYVNGTLQNLGTIQDNGNNADLSTGGGSLAATQYLRGASGGGPNGGSTTANGNPGNASSNASINNSGLNPNGGAGGNAGVQTGGAGGSAGVASTRWAGQLFQARQQVGAFGGGAAAWSGSRLAYWTTRAARSPRAAATVATVPVLRLASQAAAAAAAAASSASCRPRHRPRWVVPSPRQAARAARVSTAAGPVSLGPRAPSTTSFSGDP